MCPFVEKANIPHAIDSRHTHVLRSRGKEGYHSKATTHTFALSLSDNVK